MTELILGKVLVFIEKLLWCIQLIKSNSTFQNVLVALIVSLKNIVFEMFKNFEVD